MSANELLEAEANFAQTCNLWVEEILVALRRSGQTEAIAEIEAARKRWSEATRKILAAAYDPTRL